MKIISVGTANYLQWCSLVQRLWPNCSPEEVQALFEKVQRSNQYAAFLAETDDGDAIAFINLSLRHDYVSGASSSPTAYVEGIYVDGNYRHQNIGRSLIERAEQWAKQHGSTEIASDALIDNLDSYAFHTKIGFREVERIVTFIKPLL